MEHSYREDFHEKNSASLQAHNKIQRMDWKVIRSYYMSELSLSNIKMIEIIFTVT